MTQLIAMPYPVASLIKKCGGHAEVAKTCGVHVTRVYRWTYDRAQGGTGGVIPARYHAQLLRLARTHGHELTLADFLGAEAGAAA